MRAPPIPGSTLDAATCKRNRELPRGSVGGGRGGAAPPPAGEEPERAKRHQPAREEGRARQVGGRGGAGEGAEELRRQQRPDDGGDAAQARDRALQLALFVGSDTLRRRQAELEAEQFRLMTQLQSRIAAPPEKSTAHPWPDGQAPGNAQTDQESVVLNAQIAALTERIQAYNQAPRKQFVAPSAALALHAAYVDAWRTRIEAVGTRHFPQQARGRTYGSLQMTVYIRADGSVADAVIDRPAEHPELNLAARRIVQLAAPYPAFPAELAATTDLLAITRTWNFVNDTLDTQAP